MGLAMPHKMSILRHKVSSHPFHTPSSYYPFSYWLLHFFITGEPFVSIRWGRKQHKISESLSGAHYGLNKSKTSEKILVYLYGCPQYTKYMSMVYHPVDLNTLRPTSAIYMKVILPIKYCLHLYILWRLETLLWYLEYTNAHSLQLCLMMQLM